MNTNKMTCLDILYNYLYIETNLRNTLGVFNV